MPEPAVSPSTATTASRVALLTSLADAGDALTRALVARDHDGIVAATADADRLVAALGGHATAADGARRDAASPAMRRLGDRIALGARRNALLLERAWAADAALLRLLAAAARDEAAAAGAGPAYTATAATVPDAEPAGWLDRSA